MKYTIDELRIRSGANKNRKPRKNKEKSAVRNAEETRFAQVTRGDRGEMRRDTERKALRNIDERHTTLKTNIHHKKPAILNFTKVSRGGEPNVYECVLPDGYVIIVRKTGENFTATYRYQAYDSVYPTRKNLIGTGENYTAAVANLIGKPQFKNPHSVRWMNFYDLCYPHIHIPGNKNWMPKNPGGLPTQKRVNQLQRIDPNLGRTPESEIRQKLREVHWVNGNVKEKLAKMLTPQDKIELEEALEKSVARRPI